MAGSLISQHSLLVQYRSTLFLFYFHSNSTGHNSKSSVFSEKVGPLSLRYEATNMSLYNARKLVIFAPWVVIVVIKW